MPSITPSSVFISLAAFFFAALRPLPDIMLMPATAAAPTAMPMPIPASIVGAFDCIIALSPSVSDCTVIVAAFAQTKRGAPREKQRKFLPCHR